ncbi:cytochrome P450 [Agromyces sp. NPDC058484]|uniref:cytochrome P450 n=1 Tax=Agromyces sp. NPDC058484 TaxID=3346524 RepID=UPI0036620A96
MARSEAPVADWVTISDLYRDPFPIYERLRAEGGVHWVPAVGRYLITSYDAVHVTETDQQTFSANEQGSLQIRAMGHSMLRRDDPEHYVERRAWQPALRPGTVKRVWNEVFERNADHFLGELIDKGPGADLIWDFAAPYAGENLRQIMGLYNATHEDIQRWSQDMIDATGNYADDPEVWERGRRAFDEVDVALDEMLAWHAEHPDHSLLSSLLAMPDYRMPLEKIRANIKMTIGGGMNEPRDALGVASWALLTHPDQRRMVEADASLWNTVFEESIRWVAPIGMYSRQTTRDVDLVGVNLPKGARLGICILSANRDETVWPDAAAFDLRREVKPHLAFSKGVHVCLGAWAARGEVADVALPRLFERLRGLDLVADDPAEIGGWVFRGMLKLPVTWSGTRAADATPSAKAGVSPGEDESRSDAAPRIAIVGSGPSGSFTAQALRRVLPAAELDVFDRLPVPFGLVRYGVAADHQGTKSVSRQFERLFLHEGVRFHGNTTLGDDVSLDELRERFDAVVLATGLRHDATLKIPGAKLGGVIGSGELTRVLNGHPDHPEVPRLSEHVLVLGQGNVAMDVVRLIARDPAEFEGSDVDDRVREQVVSGVRVITVVGRSAPGAAKFDPVMVRELASLSGVEHVLHGVDIDTAPEGKDARWDALRALAATTDAPDARVRIEWWFGLTPEAFEGDDRVRTTRFSSAAGDVEIEAGTVITAIGFAAGDDTPMAPGAHPDGRVEPGLYVAGWLRRGPRGTIPDQRTDARGLAAMIFDDLAAGRITAQKAGMEPHAGAVDFDGWRRIDVRETLGAAPGRSRAKLRTREELLDAARDRDIPLPGVRAVESTAGAASGQPITILFGTESGGAELVADDLRHHLAGRDVEVVDLADADPRTLDPLRLHLVVCATYGDGEVPTSARPFHRALVEERPDLMGLRYAVFGMGDRSYTKTYSRGSELIDEALAACGAQRVGEYGRHDAGGPLGAAETAVEWVDGVLADAEETARRH